MASLNNFKKSKFWEFTANLFEYMPRNLIIALSLMVLISLSEGISLILLVPILQLVGLEVGQGSIGQIAGYVSTFFTTLGIQPTLNLVLIIYVCVMSFMAFLNWYKTIKTSKIQYEFGSHLRKRLYNSITNSNWLFFSKHKSSDFAHALTNEVERITTGTGQFLTLLASIMILIVYIVFALKLAGVITGIIFAVGIGILLVLRRRASRSHIRGGEITTTTRDLYSSIIQHLDGMKTIKSFNMQEENIHVFSNQSNDVALKYLNSIRSYADVKLIFDVGTVVVLAMMVIFLIEVIKLPTASLLILIYLFVRMIPQFSNIQRSYQYFINILPAYVNVMNLERECELAREAIDKSGDINFKDKISFENVSFSYNKEKTFFIENLNLKIPKGKTTALVGLSGGGKSTIADILMGIITPSKGKIKLDNSILGEDNLLSWRSHIGYVAQDTFLFNDTIKRNLLLANQNASDGELWSVLKLASADGFVKKLPTDLDTLLGDRGVRLSGGEKQRLALARALLRKPSLLILDEATSNLDSKNEKKIMHSIENLHGEVTILVIAHRLSTIKNADNIYLIKEGELVESGSWDDLIKNEKGEFRTLYDNQH